jgi:hypothetical protein
MTHQSTAEAAELSVLNFYYQTLSSWICGTAALGGASKAPPFNEKKNPIKNPFLIK